MTFLAAAKIVLIICVTSSYQKQPISSNLTFSSLDIYRTQKYWYPWFRTSIPGLFENIVIYRNIYNPITRSTLNYFIGRICKKSISGNFTRPIPLSEWLIKDVFVSELLGILPLGLLSKWQLPRRVCCHSHFWNVTTKKRKV